MSNLHFILTPVGSSGDVHPYVGLGRLLRRRGHDVTVITAEPFRALVEAANLAFVGGWTHEQYEQVTQDPDLWHPTRGLGVILRVTLESMRRQYECIRQVHQPGRSVLVGHPIAIGTRVFEDQHGCPAVTLHLAPAVFRSEYRQPVHRPGLDLSWLPRWTKRAMWWLIDRVYVDRHVEPGLNAFRAELGLPPVRRIFHRWLLSPRRNIGLFPAWFGQPQPDWPANLKLTGFPLFDEAGFHEPDGRLESFLNSGDPPIAFTPGSANRQADKFFAAAVDAVTRIRRRALLLTRYPQQLPASLPSHVLHVPYVPFSQVLPRCAAVVHHGGIGSCAQGLAAGVPQLIMPMGFDQPDNAARLKRLGAGDWLVPGKFTGKKLAAKLDQLLDAARQSSACKDLASRIDAEAANNATCDLMEEVGREAEAMMPA